MGDASALKPELCQVWSVGLERVDIRSSRSRHAAADNGRESVHGGDPKIVPGRVLDTVPGCVPRTGTGIVLESISRDVSEVTRETIQETVPSAAVGSGAAVGSSLIRNTPQSSSSPPGDVTVEVSTPLLLCSYWSIFREAVFLPLVNVSCGSFAHISPCFL